MEKPLLVELKRHDQIDKILSSLQEIVDSGTSVVFSFSTSGQVTVLLARPPSRARSRTLMEQDCPVERRNSYVRSDSCSPEET
jgi:hypothetical protein